MFQNISLKRDSGSFEIHGIDLAVVNAIRRTILTDIPVVAFRGEEEPSIEILKNNGPLHNEFLLHRFGLIPIHFNEEETESFVSDDYTFELQAENKNTSMLHVTSKDFQVFKHEKPLPTKEVLRLFPADAITHDHVLITRLRTGEHIHMRGKAILGTSRMHAGFSPVSLCTFSFMQDPARAATATNVLDKERAYLRNEFGDPIAYKFDIESVTGLTPKYLITKALEIIKHKVEKTLIELYQEPSEYISHKACDRGGPGYDFIFQGEDDTLGNLFQSLMYNHYIRGKKPTEKGHTVTYVGYICPHPLETVMILNMVIENGTTSEYVEALSESCRRIIADIQTILGEWQRST